mmetsp:Transcript_7540/g.10985  ORF Transcript_7540/g.10985 Transcript_7540/m.10985 type:complete len:125 (-) Transcript_7540:810-1184(-)
MNQSIDAHIISQVLHIKNTDTQYLKISFVGDIVREQSIIYLISQHHTFGPSVIPSFNQKESSVIPSMMRLEGGRSIKYTLDLSPFLLLFLGFLLPSFAIHDGSIRREHSSSVSRIAPSNAASPR